MTFIKTQNLLIAATVGLLVACGGGSSDSSSSTLGNTNAANLSKPSVYVGPIAGFGSVVVNGVRFSSVGASVSSHINCRINSC